MELKQQFYSKNIEYEAWAKLYHLTHKVNVRDYMGFEVVIIYYKLTWEENTLCIHVWVVDIGKVGDLTKGFSRSSYINVNCQFSCWIQDTWEE